MNKLKWKKKKGIWYYNFNENDRAFTRWLQIYKYDDTLVLTLHYAEMEIPIDYGYTLKALKSKAERIYQIIKE